VLDERVRSPLGRVSHSPAGAVYLMLQNRIYRGEIVHKERSYPGEHTPIIDQELVGYGSGAARR